MTSNQTPKQVGSLNNSPRFNTDFPSAQCPAEESKQPRVFVSIEQLEKETYSIAGLLEELEQRLRVVSRSEPESPECKGGAPMPSVTTVYEKIDTIVYRAATVRNKLQNLIRLLEV